MPQVAEVTRVCRYDRANNQSGRSDPAPTPRTAADIVADLHALLQAADISGPYVLVGPSVAGLFVRLYATTYPEDVVGLVLVDPSHEEQPTVLGALLTPEELALSQRLDFESGDPEGILTAESYPETLVQVRAAGNAAPLRPMPLVVLIAGQTEDLTEFGYSAHEQAVWWPLTRVFGADLAALVPDGRLIVVEESGHIIHEDQPEVVVQAITDVVNAVRPRSHQLGDDSNARVVGTTNIREGQEPALRSRSLSIPKLNPVPRTGFKILLWCSSPRCAV